MRRTTPNRFLSLLLMTALCFVQLSPAFGWDLPMNASPSGLVGHESSMSGSHECCHDHDSAKHSGVNAGEACETDCSAQNCDCQAAHGLMQPSSSPLYFARSGDYLNTPDSRIHDFRGFPPLPPPIG